MDRKLKHVSKELSDQNLDLILKHLRDPKLSCLEQFRENPESAHYIDYLPDQELRERLKNGYRALVKREEVLGR